VADPTSGDFQVLVRLRHAVALSSLLAAALGAIFAGVSWRAENARQSAYLASLLEMSSRALNSHFSGIEKALHILGEDIRDAAGGIDLKAAEVRLKRFKSVYPQLRIVIVARTDGQILATSEGRADDRLPTLAAEPSFVRSREELQRGDRLSIGRAFPGPVSGEWITPVRYGMRDAEGALRFILGAGLPVSDMQEFWKNAPLPPGAAIGMTRDDMYVVSRYPAPAKEDETRIYGQARADALSRHLLQQMLPQSGAVAGIGSITSAGTLFSYRRLPDYPVTLYVGDPESGILGAWWRGAWVPLMLLLSWVAGGIAVCRWVENRQPA
jgi:hypothetical protein